MIDPVQERIDDLIGRLRSPLARDREMAARTLVRMGARAVPKLLQALRDEDWNVRRQAAAAFALAPDSRAVPLLCELAAESDWEVRWAAVTALKAAGDPRSAPALVHRLGDYHTRLRALAAEALLSLDESHPLTCEDISGSVSYACAMNGLQDPNGMVQRASALVLGRLGDPRAISGLTELLNARQAALTAAEAASALGRLGTQAAIGPLLDTALNHRESQVRCAACRSLGLIGGDEAIGCLVTALRSRSPELRRTAALELARLAMTAPSVALRTALPNLNRCLSQGWWLGDDDGEAYGEAIRSIERATRTLRDLPVPSGGGSMTELLPVPASGEETASPEHRSTSHFTAAPRGSRGAGGFLQWLQARLRCPGGPGRRD